MVKKHYKVAKLSSGIYRGGFYKPSSGSTRKVYYRPGSVRSRVKAMRITKAAKRHRGPSSSGVSVVRRRRR